MHSGAESRVASSLSRWYLWQYTILDAYAQAYGETITPEALAEKINAYSDDLSMGDVFKNQLFESLRKSLEETATDGLEGEDLGFVGDVLQTAIQSGAFENFTAEGFDLTEPKNVLLALGGELSTSVADGITLEGAKMAEAMASQAEAIPQAAKDTLQEASPSKVMDSIGQNAGEGLARGLLKKYRAVYSAAKSLAKAAELGASITLEVHSPSKVFERLGLFSGQGFEEGYTESIRNAVQTVRRITGSLIDAANFPSGMSMPDVTRAVSTAIDSTSGPEQPIYLQVNGKTLASVTAEDNRQALNARSRRLAMGVGK